MPSHKTSLNKFKNIEIMSTTSSDSDVIRLEINYKKKSCKKHKHIEAKQYVINQPMGHQRNQIGNKKNFLDKSENWSTIMQDLWDMVKEILRWKFMSIQAYLNKKEKYHENYLNQQLKKLVKEEETIPTVSMWKEKNKKLKKKSWK